MEKMASHTAPDKKYPVSGQNTPPPPTPPPPPPPPPDITAPAHFGIGGRNPPQVFYRVDITPPATSDRVDKTPLVSFARWIKSPLSCGQNPPRTKSP